MSQPMSLAHIIDLMAEAHVGRAQTAAIIDGQPLTPTEKAALLDRMREQIRDRFTGAAHDGQTPPA